MYVEEVCLDGFKSYAQRTTVSGFDECFNAITGLNGSGKSNILDAICFVLGITNLSQVRAGTLQELVYKQGQAGVTKASVSIVFNNQDRERSPVGYEHCEQITVTRQIVIGGRNKYLINGHVAQPSRVQNLFHSVQLNVNNPHFLIMQGRITKVLNMKPPEILGMLEEAAGTRMYETKKEGALKTLEKKQAKVEEINKLLEEEILPALEKLRKERADYMKWAAANDSLERLRRFCIAYEFTRLEAARAESSEGVDELHARIADLKEAAADLERQAAEKDRHMEALAQEREAQLGGETRKLAEKVDELSKAVVQETSAWNNKKELVASERAGAEKLRKSGAALEAAAEQKAEAYAALDAKTKDQRDGLKALVDAAEHAERTLAGIRSGKGTGDDKSLAEQLADAKAGVTSAEAEGKAATLRAKHAEKELKDARQALGKKEKEAEALARDLQREEAAVEKAKAARAALSFDGASAEELQQRRAKETAAVAKCQEKVDVLRSQLQALDFQFKSPEPGFDRKRVKGVVARLLRVKDAAATTALEVMAGGKLYQVVVDTEETGKAVLDRGQLRNRVTIIPLNKIDARGASSAQLDAARRLAGDDAQVGLSLIGFDEEVRAAMSYVFGNAFVCKDGKTAREIAFNKAVGLTCVTLEGDVHNPSGLLTGGSRPQGSSVLTRLHALAEAEDELAAHKAALGEVERIAKETAAAAREAARLDNELELKQHSLRLLKERSGASEAHQLTEAVSAAEAALSAAQESASSSSARAKECAAAAKRLEKELSAFESERVKRTKEAEADVKRTKAAVAGAKGDVKAQEEALQVLEAEREAVLTERAQLDDQVASALAAVDSLQAEVDGMASRVAEQRDAYERAAAELEERRARARECDQRAVALGKERTKLQAAAAEKGVEVQKTEHAVARAERSCKEAEKREEALVNAHPWIESERQHFGKHGGDYDWDATSPEAAQAELAEAEEAHATLSKRVNKKVLGMFDKAEAEYRELTEKRRIVENDKEKIQAVISELDEKKKEALRTTWTKVTADFGSIFSTLLPGTTAKLEPPEDGTFLDGLEVRVAFGGVWKQSLTELSGGQRSLLALSLILALLLFKPAPIYILDEVDAALDLSHTQNIGRMIKTHFPQSQFIVVSLKEGMFNNANVIFRTKFVDGVSTVTRTKNNPATAAGNDAPAQKRPRAALKENVGPA